MTNLKSLSASAAIPIAALVFAAAAPPVVACSARPNELVEAFDREFDGCEHPLCGMAIAVAAPAPAQAAPLEAECPPYATWSRLQAAIDETLAAGGFVLLGEIHDNQAHHDLRAALISGLAATRHDAGGPAIVFEQIRADQRAAIAPFAKPAPGDAERPGLDALLSALAWEKSPWSKSADYRPLFSAVLSARLPVHAGDPGREAMYRAARDGSASIPSEDRTRLGLETPLGEPLDLASFAEIEEAHCGLMPKAALSGMAYAQRFRDAHMADVLISAADGSGAILIAGNGHVRADRGVPWYLARRVPGRPILAVVFSEVDEARSDPGSYVPRGPDGKAAADWLVFAPRQKRNGDPCAEMRAAFEARAKSGPSPGAAKAE